MSAIWTTFRQVDWTQAETWNGKAILTFDVDWASDEVLSHCLDLVEQAELPAVFMVTHDTPLLARMRQNSQIELGLHPNFNPLLDGVSEADKADAVLKKLKAIVPEAQVLRSHSLSTSGKWLSLYQAHGIRFTSNYCMMGVPHIQPFEHINGLVECPHYFADDGWLYLQDQGRPLPPDWPELNPATGGLRVFNFHPIHVFLNSESLARYESSRSAHRDIASLKAYRYDGFGTETLLKTLVGLQAPMRAG